MSSLKKLRKSKNVPELLSNIEYSDLSIIAYILSMIFILYPSIEFLLRTFLERSIKYYMHNYRLYVLIFGVLILIIYCIKQKLDNKNLNIKQFCTEHKAVSVLLLFAFWMIFGTILNGFPQYSILGNIYRSEGLVGYLSYIVYFLMGAFILSSKQKSKILKTIAFTSSMLSMAIIIDYFFLDYKYKLALELNSFSQFNHTGYHLLVAAMTCGTYLISSKHIIGKFFGLCGFVLHTLALLINDTWGCQIALFAGVFFLVIVFGIAKEKFQKLSILLIISLFCSYLIMYYTDSGIQKKIQNNLYQQFYDTNALFNPDEIDKGTTGIARINLWESTLKYCAEKPIIGHGADVTGPRLEQDSCSDRCHCEFMNYMVSYGIPGAVLYVVGVFMIFLRGLFKRRQLEDMETAALCVAFAYLVSSAVGNSMFYTAPYLFIMLGIGYVRTNE